MDITKEEYDEITNDVKTLKMMVQDLQDIVEDSIGNVNILSNAIATNNIKDDAITTDKIVAGAITADLIEAEAINASKIAVGTITADQIEDGTISADKILALTITASQIEANTITANEIAAITITAAEIVGETITGAKIAATTIEAGNIVTGTITGTQIHGETITSGLLETGAIHISSEVGADAGLYARSDYLGFWSGTAWQAYIKSDGDFYFGGDANNYISWNGTNLNIKGNITLLNTIPSSDVTGLGDLAIEDDVAYGDLTGTKPPTNADNTSSNNDWSDVADDDGNKPASNADVTLSAINGSLLVTGGGITLNGGGAIKSRYKDSYNDATAGFYLGYSGGYKFGIGDSTHYMQWNGSTLTIKGITTTDYLSSISANIGELIIGSTYGGEIHSYGKDSPTDTTAGFWLGYSSGYKFNIGNGNVTAGTGNCMIWDGSSLTVRGSLKVGGGSNEDITFEDSGIRFYDSGSRTLAITKTSYESFYIGLQTTYIDLVSTGYFRFGANGRPFLMQEDGVFVLNNLGSNPTGVAGGICMVSGNLKYWNGSAWVIAT